VILMLNIPATAGLMALAGPIVTLIFERGRFSPSDTAATAAALTFYAPGLMGYSAVKLISSAFYALGNSRVPLAASAISVATNIVLNLALVGPLGHRGIALGTAIAALVNSAVLLWFLRSRLGSVEDRRVVVAAVKIAAASLVMAVAAYHAERLLHAPFPGPGIVAQCLRVFGAIAAGMAVLGALAHALRIDEFAELRRTAQRWRT
jgi:putative peptidoglycan lipid II flippase